jgi:hypothetical protein
MDSKYWGPGHGSISASIRSVHWVESINKQPKLGRKVNSPEMLASTQLKQGTIFGTELKARIKGVEKCMIMLGCIWNNEKIICQYITAPFRGYSRHII